MKFKFSKESVLGVILLGMFILMAVIAPGFLDPYNLSNMMFQLPELGILALGMMVVIVTSGIDLSITYTAAFAGVMTALCLAAGMPTALAVAVGVVIALLCGLLNGFFVSVIGISPILVTLGSMVLFEGVILTITKGNAISGFPESFSLLGNLSIGPIPLPVIIFAVIAVITSVMLNRTPWGRSVYKVGINPIAVQFSGIHVKKVLMGVYLFSAFMAAIAGLIMISRYNSAKVDLGSSYLLLTISASVLGGTEISGGYGKVVGTVYAVAIFQVMSNGLNLLGVPRTIVDILMGIILIAVLTLNYFSAKQESKKALKQAISSKVSV
ncbi:ABC transporter permease [Paenibacillus faecis]|uniref:ABC transporter permease n=1 Tax=Paenibacillus faecis TaxID=862114 RepID=UPI001B1FA067|nr:ABC transporter permease [Paenibacillus faecis]GIO87042.1 ABC transporter permease [Paenibacillus faecis]